MQIDLRLLHAWLRLGIRKGKPGRSTSVDTLPAQGPRINILQRKLEYLSFMHVTIYGVTACLPCFACKNALRLDRGPCRCGALDMCTTQVSSQLSSCPLWAPISDSVAAQTIRVKFIPALVFSFSSHCKLYPLSSQEKSAGGPA